MAADGGDGAAGGVGVAAGVRVPRVVLGRLAGRGGRVALQPEALVPPLSGSSPP